MLLNEYAKIRRLLQLTVVRRSEINGEAFRLTAVAVAEFLRCDSRKMLEELAEVGRVKRQVPCNIRDGTVCCENEFFGKVHQSFFVNSAGRPVDFGLDGVAQVRGMNMHAISFTSNVVAALRI